MWYRRFILALLVLVQFALLESARVFADQVPVVDEIFLSNKYAGLVIHAPTKKVLYDKNSEKKRYPASLTKMMTLYIVFDALEKGSIKLNQKLVVSKKASMQPSSNLRLKPRQVVTVRDMVYATIIKSANDASYVLAEKIGKGSAPRFVGLMNAKAKRLGMQNTHFTNPNGLHHPQQITTARDMATLAMALMNHHKRYFKLFSKTSFRFQNKLIVGHNKVLNRIRYANGIKTGYTRASGFNLVTSATYPNGKLVAVVLGGQSAQIRDNHMVRLLNVGHQRLSKRKTPDASKILQYSVFDVLSQTSFYEFKNLNKLHDRVSVFKKIQEVAQAEKNSKKDFNTNASVYSQIPNNSVFQYANK